MAGIKVVLELDKRQYEQALKDAASASSDFSKQTQTHVSNSNKGFDLLSKNIDLLHNRFVGLKTAIAGVGFAALTRNALEFAASIKDLSDSTGIAINSLVDLSSALTVSGVSADKMPEIVSRFSQSLEEAAGSAGKTLYTFEQLGVTLTDIGQKSTQEALMATLEGLVKMGPGVERTARMVELFGKAGRTMDPQGVLDSLRNAGDGSKQYSDNIRSAAELSDQLSLASKKLSIALLNAFGPAITKLAEFADNVNKNKETLDALASSLKAVGAILATVFGGTILLGFVKAIGIVGRGITAAGVAMGVFADSARSVFAPMGKILVIGRAIALLAGIGFGIYSASQLFDDFKDRAVNAISYVIENLGLLSAALAGGAFGAGFGSAFGPAGTVIGGITGALAGGAAMEAIVAQARKAREETEAAAKAKKALEVPSPGVLDTTLPGPDGGPAGADTKGAFAEIARRTAAIEKSTEAYFRQNQRMRESIGLDETLVGKSKDVSEIARAQTEIINRSADTIRELIEQKSQLTEQDSRYAAVIDAQIAKINANTEAELQALTAALKSRQAKEAADRIALQTARGQNELDAIRAQLLNYNITSLEKFNQAQAAGDFRDKTKEEIQLLKDQAEAQDNLTNILTVLNIQRESGSKVIELETQILGRQFTELEKLEQLKLRNPEAFARKTQAEVTALQQQASAVDNATRQFQQLALARDLERQGEDFKASLKEQLKLDSTAGESARRRIQIEIDGRNQLQAKLREINDRYGDESKLSEELQGRRRQEIGEATNGINNLIALKKKAVEEDQAQRDTFAYGWENAFARYADDAFNAANEAKTYFDAFSKGFEDAFVKMVQTGKLSFKDLANTMIAEFTRIQAKRLFAGLFGDMSGGGLDLFGGIKKIFGFANGGNPPIGIPSIVGEKGPELFVPRTAGTIIPNGQFGTTGMNTNVIYNINAVDAASFRQMLAREPEFLYAVTEKGRSAIPSGRR